MRRQLPARPRWRLGWMCSSGLAEPCFFFFVYPDFGGLYGREIEGLGYRV